MVLTQLGRKDEKVHGDHRSGQPAGHRVYEDLFEQRKHDVVIERPQGYPVICFGLTGTGLDCIPEADLQ